MYASACAFCLCSHFALLEMPQGLHGATGTFLGALCFVVAVAAAEVVGCPVLLLLSLLCLLGGVGFS